MKKTEQRRIVREFLAAVRADIMRDLEHAPEHWDGFELKQFVADAFQASAWLIRRDKRRYRQYRRDCAVMP